MEILIIDRCSAYILQVAEEGCATSNMATRAVSMEAAEDNTMLHDLVGTSELSQKEVKRHGFNPGWICPHSSFNLACSFRKHCIG